MKKTKWNVCLTTYEYILKEKNYLVRTPWKYIVLDEGHKLKNNKSKTSLALCSTYKS